MFSFSMHKMRAVTIATGAVMAAGAMWHLAASTQPATAPDVIYTAQGTFASPQLSGADLFQLAGESFKIYVTANMADAPHATGTGWAAYTDLKLQGLVGTGLDPSPVPIASSYTFMALAIGTANDALELAAPVTVIKSKVTMRATIKMPLNTFLKGWRIYPFGSKVTLAPATATASYANGTDTTTLAIASGSLTATLKK